MNFHVFFLLTFRPYYLPQPQHPSTFVNYGAQYSEQVARFPPNSQPKSDDAEDSDGHSV